MKQSDHDCFIDDNGFSPIPCPNCGSKVQITSSRDCDVLSTYASCTNSACEGNYFTSESNAVLHRPKELEEITEFELVAVKYFYWAKSERSKEGYRCSSEWD
jgi:predicted RNA-binding Zn-ribbon protein involved in translation (DUF1610 family)